MIHIGNAPCSWGNLEWEDNSGSVLTYSRMLDELVAAGYTGTELGDWGFMPTDAPALSAELRSRNLTMTGAFVPVEFSNRSAHADGIETAVRIAKLLAAVQIEALPPFVVLADENCSEPDRTRMAGHITPDMMLDGVAWKTYGHGVNAVARAVNHETGLRCVFHHHCGGWVETPAEIDALLNHTDAALVGLVFDTGHFSWGTGTPSSNQVIPALEKFKSRMQYIHLKDCEPHVAHQGVSSGWDYHDNVRNGVFCELGKGIVPFPDVIAWLRIMAYSGFATVEQDVLPSMGSPLESAQRNRAYLRDVCGL